MTGLEDQIRAIVRDELAKAKPANDDNGADWYERWRTSQIEIERLRKKLATFRQIAISPPVPGWRTRHPDQNDIRAGRVYAIVLVPEITPHRVKIGFTNTSIADRMLHFSTTCPTAVVAGGWPATRFDEARVHAEIPGRIGDSEVFVVGEVESLLARIDEILSVEAPA